MFGLPLNRSLTNLNELPAAVATPILITSPVTVSFLIGGYNYS